ncbi:MAG: MFS transporter [Myxococcota bacterium]
MIRPFYLYAILRNLRFFEAFFVLFLLLDLELSYTLIGVVLAYEKLLMGLCEVPLAVIADRLGRRRALMTSFALASVAFAIFGLSAESSAATALVFVGQTIYGVGESLRTGTHKAIVLDWLSSQGLSHRRVEVLGKMRFFSKTSAGVAALVAGLLVWSTGQVSALFWAAIVPTLMGVLLLSRYPATAEGELERARKGEGREGAPPLREALSRGGVWALIVPSLLFESQIKLAIAYLQPALAEGSTALGLEVLGGLGALVVGGYMALSGALAGSASLISTRILTMFGGAPKALLNLHLAAAVVVTIACVGFYAEQAWLGLVLMAGLAALQNARRPIFVTAIDDEMAPHYRATTLSVESQGRSWLYAGTSIAVGWAADTWSLAGAFALMALLLWGAVLTGRR